MRGNRRSSRRRALIETETRPCRKNNINENNDCIKKSLVNSCKINLSENSSSCTTSNTSSSSSNNTSSSSSTSSSTLNSSDRSNRSSKRLTKLVAAMAAVTFSTLLVYAHYSALVQGGTQSGVSSPVGNTDGTIQDTFDTEAAAAAFARMHAEGIIDSVAPGSIHSPETAGGKRARTARNTLKENPESDRKKGLKNASIGKIPPIQTIRGPNKDKRDTHDSKGAHKPSEKKKTNGKEKSVKTELHAEEKKLEASDLKTMRVSMEKSPQELRREEEEGDSLLETWSEDGRVHCIEESPDLIMCHTHDVVEEDENVNDLSKETKSKSGKNYRMQTETRIPGSPNRLTGSNVTGSQSTKSSTWKGFSRENQPDGLLLPTDKISDRKRPLVRLDLTADEPKVINVDTGEIKSLKMLSETEDVEINSLVSTYKPRGKGSNFATHGPEQSLQELLTELREQNFLELDIDYEEKLVYRIWQNDTHCNRFATRFGRGVPEVDLVAYPRSGSSWLRYLLESATGVFTGTAHASNNSLHQLGFLGEAEAPYTRRTLTLLTHSASANLGVEWQAVQGGRDNVPAILLIRDPADAIASHWMARNTSGQDAVSGTSPLDTLQTPEFHDFAEAELEKWEQTYSNRLLWSRLVHVLHYEDLSRRPLLELLKVLRFLQLPPPSGGRLYCLRKHIEGRLKGRRKKHNPYTTLEEDVLWSSVTRVAALLQLRGLDLPDYHMPLEEYPPDRIYKSFIKRLEENGSHKTRQKDEL